MSIVDACALVMLAVFSFIALTLNEIEKLLRERNRLAARDTVVKFVDKDGSPI